MSAAADVSRERLRLRGAGVEVVVSLQEGTYSVGGGDGSAPITAAFAWADLDLYGNTLITTDEAVLEVASGPERFEDAHGRGVRAVLATDVRSGVRLHLEIAAYDAQPFALLTLGVENAGRQTARLGRLTPLAAQGRGGLAFASPARDWRYFRHGWQSWSPSLSLRATRRDLPGPPPVLAPAATPSERGAFASDEVGALFDPASGRTVVLGFVTARRQWTQVRLDAGRRYLEATAFADGAPLRPGETMWSERLLVQLTDDAPAALAGYAAALGREMGARVPASAPTGWCSWYQYFETVTEEDVLKNLRFLEEHRDALPFKCVQIDDGYQANIGDWMTTNEKFPRGMAWLAREIRNAGFTPGLWLAPFLVGETSRLYAEHPEWVVRDEAGEPIAAVRNWDQRCFGLDTTHLKAERWLRDLFREVTSGLGYDYVKIDFLYGAAIAGRRRDRNASRVEAYRRGLTAIREAVDKRFVLGCGALMGASAGLVDGQRIGPDVDPRWRYRPQRPGGRVFGGEPSVEHALRNVVTRSWMHGRLWANDPDCLLARQTQTKLTLPEVQSLATAIALSGGAVFASDDLTQLSRERIDVISLLLPPLGEAATARELMESSMPSTLEVAVRRPFESWRLLGAFNWKRRQASLRVALPPGRWHVFELWDGRYYGEREGAVELPDVPAHGARLLALRRPRGRPQLLTTTFHASMGGREVERVRYDSKRDVLHIDLTPVAKQRGEVLVHAPRGYRLIKATLGGSLVAARRAQPGVVAIALELAAPRRLRLRFVRRG